MGANKPIPRQTHTHGSPLARRLVLATIAVSTLFAIFTTALQLYLDYRRDVASIDTMLGQVEWSRVPSLSLALWSINRGELQIAVDGIARLPDVAQVVVRDDEFIWAESGGPGAAMPLIRDYPLVYNDRGQQVPIGTLRVVVDMRGVYDRLLTTLWVILATNAIKTFVVALFVLWFFRRLVTRHLDTLANYATRLGMGDWSPPPALDRSHRPGAAPDELDTVMDALTRMHDGLKRAVDALRASEERYRLLCDNSNDAIFLIDAASGRILDANPLAERQYGYTHDELLNLTIRDLSETKDAERIPALSKRLLTDGHAVFERLHRARDGRVIPVEVSSRVMTLDGRALFVSMVRDLTERKHTQDLLRKLSSAVEQSHCSIVITDTSGVIEYINPAFVAKSGYTTDEIIGKTPRLIHSEHTPPHIVENLWMTLKAEQTWRGELLNRRKDGQVFWDSVTISPLKNTDGVVTHFLAIQTDISELKRREDEIRLLNTELELRVKRRTAELEAANQELETFSYSVSHDLRAPLRAIDGYSQILEEEYASSFDERGAEYLRRMRAATQRMGMLIDDLLGLSRISRAHLRREPIDLSQLVNEVAAEITRAEPARAVALHVEPNLRVVGDANLVRVVLQNLLGNALKYTRRASNPSIEFAATRQDGQQVLYIRDNGAGFDMRYADKLFTPFQRLHAAHEFEGTGIGLATAARIIRRHGGRVWATAEPNRGATFYFTLGDG